MFTVAVCANWGLGLEVVRSLHEHPLAEIAFVVTGFDKDTDDFWRNCVADFAREHGYGTLHQDDTDFDRMRGLILERGADLLLCHAYMKWLPRSVFDAPRLGSVNIHGSLLPRYPGRSPHRDVLAAGERETGLTAHFMDEGLDTGEILHQVAFPLDRGETVETLLEKQKRHVNGLVLEIFNKLEAGSQAGSKTNNAR